MLTHNLLRNTTPTAIGAAEEFLKHSGPELIASRRAMLEILLPEPHPTVPLLV
jgi:hypothetical protein